MQADEYALSEKDVKDSSSEQTFFKRLKDVQKTHFISSGIATVIFFGLGGWIASAYLPTTLPLTVYQSFFLSPEKNDLAISDFFPVSSLNPGKSWWENNNVRRITRPISFNVMRFPYKTHALMKIPITFSETPSAVLSIRDANGSVFSRFLGENPLLGMPEIQKNYSLLWDASKDLALLQKRDTEVKYSSIDDFLASPPREKIGSFYPPLDQLAFPYHISFNDISLPKERQHVWLRQLPAFIITSMPQETRTDNPFTLIELHWNLESISLRENENFSFNLFPADEKEIMVKPIHIELR